MVGVGKGQWRRGRASDMRDGVSRARKVSSAWPLCREWCTRLVLPASTAVCRQTGVEGGRGPSDVRPLALGLLNA